MKEIDWNFDWEEEDVNSNRQPINSLEEAQRIDYHYGVYKKYKEEINSEIAKEIDKIILQKVYSLGTFKSDEEKISWDDVLDDLCSGSACK